MLDAPVLMLLFGVAVMIGLIVLHVPVGVSMAATGLLMFSLQVSLPAALGTVAPEVLAAFTSRDLVTIPLFLLMGSLAARAGISGDIYNLASSWIGHLRGGVADSGLCVARLSPQPRRWAVWHCPKCAGVGMRQPWPWARLQAVGLWAF
jgi:TRAP-type mannitol/chloroaromatic compound transport system permease large subunit